MNKQLRKEIIESLDDSRKGQLEMAEADNFDELIYQGWVEALEYVIDLTGMTEAEFRIKSGIKDERKSNDRRYSKKKERRKRNESFRSR